MELLKNFGIDPYLFVAQIVNFLIILYVLKRYAYKPVFQLLKSRQRTIQLGLAQAEESRVRLEKATEAEKKILKDAQREAVKIIDMANQKSENILTEAEQSVKKQTERMIQEAKNQIEDQARLTEQRITENVSNIAMQFLRQSLKGLFGKEEQEELMDRAIKQIKKSVH